MTDDQPRVLTLEESQERARLVTVSGYAVDLDLTRGDEVFGSRTVVRFGCASPGAATFVELRADRVVGTRLNGRPLGDDSWTANRLTLSDLLPENVLEVEADLRYTGTGEGMHRFVDPIDGQAYVGAYLGVDNAQRVFACFDQPDLKAPVATTVLAPTGWTVLSNGPAEEAVTAEGRWTFATTPPLSTYLFVVVAGPLHSVRTRHQDLPMALHCRASLAAHLDAQAAEIFAITRACFDHYTEIFDEPYLFGHYDQAFVPELTWGAMESPGCVTFRDDHVFRSAVTDVERQLRALVIAHEMAHMWFGDLVTMRWWDDLWLSEAFAEYMGHQTLSKLNLFAGIWTAFAVTRKWPAYDADQRRTTHPVAPDASGITDTGSALANFDGISYVKGASAIRQLVEWLGEEVFLAAVNDFLRAHRFGTATLSDLLASLSRGSGADVTAWSDAWLRTTGVDTLRVRRTGDRGTEVRVEHPGLRPHRLMVGRYDADDADPTRLVLRRRDPVTLSAGGSEPVPGGQDEPAPALLLLNDLDLGYAKVRLDPESQACALDRLDSVADPLSRAVVWTSLRDQVRDGELAAQVFLTAVSRHLTVDDDVAIVEAVLEFTRREVIDRCLPAVPRAVALATLGQDCREILRRTALQPRSGLRLAAARQLIGTAHTADDVAGLREALASGALPGGPELDADLTWRVMLRLSVLGAVGHDDIEHQLARDATGAGPEGAARCRAALPDPRAKAAAWDLLFDAGDGAASAYLVTATAGGFWQPEQHDLLAPFVDRYFDAAVEVAARRGPYVALVIGGPGFPFHAVDESTLRSAERCLAAGTAGPALTRRLADQVDDLRRVLRVRSLTRA